jgi:hypothetical protein
VCNGLDTTAQRRNVRRALSVQQFQLPVTCSIQEIRNSEQLDDTLSSEQVSTEGNSDRAETENRGI